MNQLILLIVFLFTTNLFAQVPNYVPKNGLIGWWGFSGNANDESGNGNHGIFKNGANLTKDRFNNVDKAVSLEGDSSYILTSLDTFNIKGYTINSWFRTVNIMSGNIGLVVSRNKANSANGLFFVNNFVYQQSVSGCMGDYGLNEKAQVYNDGIWHMYTLSYDGQKIRGYIDGILFREQNANIQICINNPFEFGRDRLFKKYFIGDLDDIGIWDRALAQSEVSQLFSLPSSVQLNDHTNPDSQFHIYPNPTNSYVIIDCGDPSEVGAYSFVIINSLGQEKVSSKFTTRFQQIDISGIGGAGLYIISIRDGNNTVIETRKLLIQ